MTTNTRRQSRGEQKTERPNRVTETTDLGTIEDRPKRVPLHEARASMKAEGLDPNYVYHWFHNTEKRTMRLANAERAGYVYVKKSEGVKIGICTVNKSDSPDSVITMQLGSGHEGYFMKLHRDLYNEDMKAKRELINDPKQQFNTAKRELNGGFGELRQTTD